jgi:hypothetical protein
MNDEESQTMKNIKLHRGWTKGTDEGILVDGRVFTSYLGNGKKNNLIPLEIDGKWGYADKTSGRIAIEPAWDWAASWDDSIADGFVPQYAMVIVGTKSKVTKSYRVGSRNGEEIFYDCWEWSEDSRCGYINTSGELVIQPKYSNGEDFDTNGLLIVRKPGVESVSAIIARGEEDNPDDWAAWNAWGAINAQEEIVIDFEWHEIWYWIEGEWEFLKARKSAPSGGGRIYALFQSDGREIIRNLDDTDDDGILAYEFTKRLRHEGLEEQSITACKHMLRDGLFIVRGDKYGFVTGGTLIAEPKFSKMELVEIIVAECKKRGEMLEDIMERYAEEIHPD